LVLGGGGPPAQLGGRQPEHAPGAGVASKREEAEHRQQALGPSAAGAPERAGSAARAAISVHRGAAKHVLCRRYSVTVRSRAPCRTSVGGARNAGQVVRGIDE
jgi:hypothetical protein